MTLQRYPELQGTAIATNKDCAINTSQGMTNMTKYLNKEVRCLEKMSERRT